MHGRPRPPVGEPEDPERRKASEKRLSLFSRLCNEVLERRAAKRYDAESMKLAAKLLEQNPEVYTVWNYRREALMGILKGEQGGETAAHAAKSELKLTETAIRKNPKSYAAWHHRKWLVALGVAPLDVELQLVTKLQEMDSRNFHAWAYRRWITAKAGTSPEREAQYTMDLINTNFSDYSAWHARTALLPQLHAVLPATLLKPGPAEDSPSNAYLSQTASIEASGVVSSSAIEQELDLVEQATFTDPSDQSAWIYHRWLLSQSLERYQDAQRSDAPQQDTAYQELQAILQREICRCESLLDAEDDRSKCKWPMLTMARLLELHKSIQARQGAEQQESNKEGCKRRLEQLYTELAEIDPKRKGYYEDALAGKASVLVQQRT